MGIHYILFDINHWTTKNQKSNECSIQISTKNKAKCVIHYDDKTRKTLYFKKSSIVKLTPNTRSFDYTWDSNDEVLQNKVTI